MSVLGVILLLAGSIIIARTIHGAASSSNVYGPINYEVIAIAAGAVFGGFVASELLGRYGEWGYASDGLYILPAAIGAVVVGLVVAAVMHFVEGRFQHHA